MVLLRGLVVVLTLGACAAPACASPAWAEASRERAVQPVRFARWRTTYQFTRFMFVRLRTDWDAARATLRGQYLFGWTPSPGTAIYAGYNDVATIDGFDARSGAAIPGYRRTGRTLFVKVSYLLRTVF